MNRFLFVIADFLSRPPGFYVLIAAMIACTAMVPFGLTNVITYALSVAAIVITGVVLIQGYRDTAAIHAKLDEIIVALKETRNNVVGLEHAEPEEIKAHLARLELEAAAADQEAKHEGVSGAKLRQRLPSTGSGKRRSGRPHDPS
jgi:low affinity Fe/Cu permease